MEQIIITSHIVKPTSPTPISLKNHKLSFLDQIAPPVYVPLIFFYENDESNSMQHDEIARRLKQSLSKILTIFYPLAGTLNSQNLYVDCNDRGAEFVEARVHGRLQEFTENPKMEELKQLLPADSLSHDDNATLMSVKTSFFDCGGFSIGVCLSHKVADGASAAAFMNAWAATCRSEEAASRIIHPSFDLALHFPPRDLPPWASGFIVGITKEKIVTKRLVFEKEKVEKLRKEASIGEIKNPSRVEAVLVFIWRCFIEAYKKTTETTSFAASHFVNLRPRAVPSIPDQTFGNCVTTESAVISSEEDDGSSDLLVSELRGAIRAVDDDFIKYVINDDDHSNRLVNEAGDLFRSGNCVFTSWWRFPVYEVDFGWGKPVWVCTATMPYTNLVVLMDNPSRDGVEAWINVPLTNTSSKFSNTITIISLLN